MRSMDVGTFPVPRITGSTRLFAVLGDPVEQVRAPTLLNPLFVRLGVDAVLVPVHARPESFAEVVHGLQRVENLDGMLVTIPHKAAACRCADELSPSVLLTGTANALRRDPGGTWFADNFDGAGFVKGLESAGHTPRGKRVVLVGAGGAGCAIAAALLIAGAAHVSVCDLDAQRVHALVSRLDQRWPGRVTGTAVPELDTADVAVNATPLGMRPDDPLPFAPQALPPGRVVADIIMKPRQTRLLTAAAALGHRVHHGAHMLDHQLDLYRAFFGIGVPAAPGRGGH